MRFHMNLPVKDIKKTTEFYSILFDGPPVKEKPDYVKFLPAAASLNISFHQDPQAVSARLGVHVGLECKDQETLDALHRRLSDQGLISVQRETSICCYANQDKFWVNDPSGYEWEIYVLLEDTAKKIDEKSGCCAANSACC
jgi:catechol 2,3-dioxygenase-like lactoylglutathione lyase family enzyme